MESDVLQKILEENLKEFLPSDKTKAYLIQKNLKRWARHYKSTDLLDWWKEKGPLSISALQTYLFWLWRYGKIPEGDFNQMYEYLNPVLSKVRSLPVEITDGLDYPLFHNGFMGHEFTVFNYRFTPSDKGWSISFTELPESQQLRYDLDQLLDIFSYVLDCHGYQALGFRQLKKRMSNMFTTALISSGMGPESRLLCDYDFNKFEYVLSQIQYPETDQGLSLQQLLRVRHRAILDSSLESKLITLWAAIDAEWGEVDQEDQFFAREEKKQIEECLKFLGNDKIKKLIDHIGRLKNKTKNDRIAEGVSALDCMRGLDAGKLVREIGSWRSRFAHGGALDEKDRDKVSGMINTLLQILNEVIGKQFESIGIIFRSA